MRFLKLVASAITKPKLKLYKMLGGFFLPVLFAVLAAAAPSPTLRVPDETVQLVKRASCTPVSAGDESVDDTPAIHAALASCGSGGVIFIPWNKQYTIRSMLDFSDCVSCDFQIEGTLKISDDVDYWQTQPAIIHLSGVKDAKIHSTTGSGIIDGNGQAAYNFYEENRGSYIAPLCNVTGNSSGIAISSLKIINAPNTFFVVEGGSTDVSYYALTMTVSSEGPTAFPYNTDGFQIRESSHITISSVIVTNYGECVAFMGGANYASVTDITCSTLYGISGALLGQAQGSVDIVRNIHVSRATVISTSLKGVGFEIYPGDGVRGSYGTAIVSNVTFEDITVADVRFAVMINSCFNAGSSYCQSFPSNANLTGIYFKNFRGMTNWVDSPAVAELQCPPHGSCDLHFSGWTAATPNGDTKFSCSSVSNTSTGLNCI
jgi:galacturan 1,4-alpha-galacturonidase